MLGSVMIGGSLDSPSHDASDGARTILNALTKIAAPSTPYAAPCFSDPFAKHPAHSRTAARYIVGISTPEVKSAGTTDPGKLSQRVRRSRNGVSTGCSAPGPHRRPGHRAVRERTPV